jgi:hypothetical protein
MMEPPPYLLGYFSAKTNLTDPRGDQPSFFANGPFLVMKVDACLPGRCIKCNRDTEQFYRKRVAWADTPPDAAGKSLRLFRIQFFGIFFAVVSMIRWFAGLRTFKAPIVVVGLCGRHRVRTRLLTVAAYSAFPAGLAILFMNVNELLNIWGPALGIVVSAIAWTRPRPVKAVHIGVGYVTLAGIGRPFLQSIASPRENVEPRSTNDIASSTQLLKERMAAKKDKLDDKAYRSS